MKTLLVVFSAFLSSCLFYTLALADICTDVERYSGLDLNEAECYVLKQVEKGEAANFKVSYNFKADFEERFFEKEDRTLRADFLKRLLTGELPGLKITKKGVQIFYAGIKERFYIRNTIIPFTFFLSRCIFDKEVDFRNVRFDKGAYFMATTFSEKASFDGVKFSGKATFLGTKFSGEASFEGGTKFCGEASFVRATFSEKASFLVTTFSEKALFYYTNFSKEASFVSATFSGKTSFVSAKFFGKAFFRGATFSGETSFYQAIFLKEADFPSCAFSSKSNFKNALFYDTVIFDDVSGFSKMVVEWKYSPDKFGYEHNNATIKLRELKNHLKYNETFYIALIKNSRDMGWFPEADDCYYTYRVEKRKHRLSQLSIQDKEKSRKASAFSTWSNKARLYGEWLLLDLIFGYGVKPWKLFKSYVFLWLIFILVYIFFLRLHYQYGRKTSRHWSRKIIRSAVHSIDTLTPGINLYAFTELRPFYFDTSSLWKKLLLNFFQRCQQVLGWYLAALFLILFSRVWIR